MRAGFLVGLGALALVAACQQVLGIEDAELDRSNPTGGSGGGGSGGNAGQAGTDGGAGASGSGGDSGTPQTLCERYCNTVMTNCTGVYAQYDQMESCLTTCRTLDPGQADAGKANTVHCRLTQAELATREKSFYCPRSGPMGSGELGQEACSTECEALCGLYETACGTGEGLHYASVQACLTDCAALPFSGPYTFNRESEPIGNTRECRIYHMTVATGYPDDHCPHAHGMAPCNERDAGR